MKAAADSQYTGSLHLIVRDSARPDGFALFGGHRLRHRFSHLYFGDGAGHRLGLGWHRRDAEAASVRLVRQYGLVVFTGASLPPALAPETLRLPLMVDFEKPMPHPIEGAGAGWTRSARADISRVKRAGFRCTVDHGIDWIPAFRREFAGPSMARRHGAEAITATARRFREIAGAGGAEFLRVWLDDAWVGGIFNSSSPDGYRLHYLGWRRGDVALLRQHVVGAMYWFSFCRAAELGHTRCLLGGVWPSLEDGVFQYKGKWGGRLDWTARRHPDIHLLIDPAHDTCRRFLHRHSLVARNTSGEFVVFSARTPAEAGVPPSVLASLSHWYRWRRPADGPRPVEDADVPARLRPQLVAEPLPPDPHQV